MSVNHELYNEQRAKGDAALAEMKTGYEGKFEKVSTMARESTPLSFLKYVPPAPDISDVKVLDNYEVKGTGETLKEAFEDWQRHLGTKPQAGTHLVWRVLPECDWQYNFITKSVRWRVYARFAVFPTGEL